MFRYLIFFKIKCIGVTLVNGIVQVSSAQFYNTSSAYSIVCSPPRVKSPSATMCLTPLDPCLPSRISSFSLVTSILLSVCEIFVHLILK